MLNVSVAIDNVRALANEERELGKRGDASLLGFQVDSMLTLVEMAKVPRDAIAELVAYSYASEERDWAEQGEPASGHVFTSIRSLQEWLEKTAHLG